MNLYPENRFDSQGRQPCFDGLALDLSPTPHARFPTLPSPINRVLQILRIDNYPESISSLDRMRRFPLHLRAPMTTPKTSTALLFPAAVSVAVTIAMLRPRLFGQYFGF